MSFFHLCPAKGKMPIHLVETIVCKRVDYLKLVLKQKYTVDNEYVLEGSLYDNVGHFMLCIMAILGENNEFKQFFLMTEIELFRRRLLSLSSYGIRLFAKKLLEHLKKSVKDDYKTIYSPLQVMCEHLILKNLAQHISSHENDCSIHKISMYFKHCLHLVATRQVELKNGTAMIPCGKWEQYLIHLYSKHLSHTIYHTDMNPLKSDPIINGLLIKFRRDIFPSTKDKPNTPILLSKEVENNSKFFPPCMLNLHRNLRNKHRLSHSQRFYYSLFLKDIGMPVEEAIEFWKQEYRQSPNGHHSCCHNWEKDERKYLYGIRHMYGLEGARKNYTSVNCKRIQSDMSCSEGGCPFKSFDEPKMLSLMTQSNSNGLVKIKDLMTKGQHTAACVTYLQDMAQIENNTCDNLNFNFTPVKYYAIASKCSTNELVNC